MPPAPLLNNCGAIETRTFTVTRDIVESRQDWIDAYCECASKLSRLIQWHTEQDPPNQRVCIAD